LHEGVPGGASTVAKSDLGDRRIERFAESVGEIVATPGSHLSNSAGIADKPLQAILLAEPFPGTVDQGAVLVFS